MEEFKHKLIPGNVIYPFTALYYDTKHTTRTNSACFIASCRCFGAGRSPSYFQSIQSSWTEANCSNCGAPGLIICYACENYCRGSSNPPSNGNEKSDHCKHVDDLIKDVNRLNEQVDPDHPY